METLSTHTNENNSYGGCTNNRREIVIGLEGRRREEGREEEGGSLCRLYHESTCYFNNTD